MVKGPKWPVLVLLKLLQVLLHPNCLIKLYTYTGCSLVLFPPSSCLTIHLGSSVRETVCSRSTFSLE